MNNLDEMKKDHADLEEMRKRIIQIYARSCLDSNDLEHLRNAGSYLAVAISAYECEIALGRQTQEAATWQS